MNYNTANVKLLIVCAVILTAAAGERISRAEDTSPPRPNILFLYANIWFKDVQRLKTMLLDWYRTLPEPYGTGE